MSTKQLYRTSNPYESLFHYARAIRKGPFIFISGTTCIPPSGIPSPVPTIIPATSSTSPPAPKESEAYTAPPSAYTQTQLSFANAVSALEALGGSVAEIVRVRMFVRDEEDCGEVGRGMKEFFDRYRRREGGADGKEEGEEGEGGVEFAATMVAGVRFVRGDLRVEVEVDAVGDV